MAHCARETTDSLNKVMDKLSYIFLQYDDVFPFYRVKEVHLDCPSTGWMEELTRELIRLARGDGPGLDSVD
jgi:hypothetical protein